jgi:hypothetical protein
MNNAAAQGPIYLRRSQAAEYITTHWGIRCQTRTLAKYAVLGGGPIFRKAGRTPLYTRADLDEWAQSRIGAPQRSTSDTGACSPVPPMPQ